jgi:hypothetical protein
VKRREFLKSLITIPIVLFYLAKLQEGIARHSILLLDSVIAGFQYYEGEKIWQSLKPDQPLRLVREPQNPYDERAIEVYWKNYKLGYIPRVDNSVIAQLMDRGVVLKARISWLKQSEDLWEKIGIKVEMEM